MTSPGHVSDIFIGFRVAKCRSNQPRQLVLPDRSLKVKFLQFISVDVVFA
jgi:hypothetical protein